MSRAKWIPEHDQGGARCTTLNGRPIDTRPAREGGGAGIEAWCMGLLVATGLRGQGRAMAFVRAGAQRGLQVLSAPGQWLVRAWRQIDSVPEGQARRGAPGALQGLGHLVRTLLTRGMA